MLLARDIIFYIEIFFIVQLKNNLYLCLCHFPPPCQINLAFGAERKTNGRCSLGRDTMTSGRLWQGNAIAFPNTNLGLPSPKTAETKETH